MRQRGLLQAVLQRRDARRETPAGDGAPLCDVAKSVGVLALVTLVGFVFSGLGVTEANIITVYILGVLIVSVVTARRVYSLLASAASVLIFNFFFTVPRFTFKAYASGYPVTFAVMFLAALIVSSLTAKLKEHAKRTAQAAYRTEVLFETNRLLQQAKDGDAILAAAARQLGKLLGREISAALAQSGALAAPGFFCATGEAQSADRPAETESAAIWALQNNNPAGASTATLPQAKRLYFPVGMNDTVYGVVGVAIEEGPLDAFEKGVLLSILGECALALENEKNAREKEEAAVAAKNEQLRANLLRAISHDLRTPLTSISGNASNLLSNAAQFDERTRAQIYTDIYDDSLWLISLVENLLAVSRIEEGKIRLHVTSELMDEVITEALRHIDRKSTEHRITVQSAQELILAKMDARLIVQVVINIVDNAIKYTPAGSAISIFSEERQGTVYVRIADDGPGIPAEAKKHVFDMFYSGKNRIADSRRSLGLGLSVCKSILSAHGGAITVADNWPHGAVFTFTLPAGEVNLHE